jgi:Fur family ferric uptake transcriptional regulator
MKPPLPFFQAFLQERGYRLTSQRKIILRLFLGVSRHLTIEDWHRFKAPQVGIATVYRTLNLFLTCGLARETVTLHGRRLIEPASARGNHEHLMCTHCGRILEFHHPLIDSYQKELARQHHFIIAFRRLTLYGVCKSCRKYAK